MISNSGKDENGKYHGGKAGDQTGHEWEVIPWYNRPQNVVLRYPDINVGLRIADLAKKAALNNKIGYDQDERTTFWKQLQSVGYDPSKITVACESDCTAGVTACVKATGYLKGLSKLSSLSPDIYSGNMRSAFTKAGFKALTDNKYLTSDAYLLPGDVLLYEGHHAATNLDYGSKSSSELRNYKNGWVKNTDGTEQYYNNGVLVTNQQIKTDGIWYRVDGLGYKQHGWIKEVKNNVTKWYYLDLVTGAMLLNRQLYLDNKKYYLGSDGVAYSQKWFESNKNWFYFGSDCSMKTSSWILWKEKSYYVQASGIMATDAYIRDEHKNVWYYVDKDGVWDNKTLYSLPAHAYVVH